MKKIILATTLILVLILIFVFSIIINFKNETKSNPAIPQEKEQESLDQNTKEEKTNIPVVINIPLDNALARITKKPFGIKVSPSNSPVTPEKFSGFHTGTDFEIFESEKEQDVQVRAICDGEIIQKTSVGGYGGVIIQKCQHENNSVLVLYGHILLDSSTQEKEVKKGDFLALLSPANSPQSGYERKHLHLGIIKGEKIDYHGYVQTEKELSNWIDSEIILQKELRN
ncbi:MAG: M23 family metallopeptidase [Candidatus Moraniibacteriota bacterium]